MSDNYGHVPAGGDLEKHQALSALRSLYLECGQFSDRRATVTTTDGFKLAVEMRGHCSKPGWSGDMHWLCLVDLQTGRRYGGQGNVRTGKVQYAPLPETLPASLNPAYVRVPELCQAMLEQPPMLETVDSILAEYCTSNPSVEMYPVVMVAVSLPSLALLPVTGANVNTSSNMGEEIDHEWQDLGRDWPEKYNRYSTGWPLRHSEKTNHVAGTIGN